MKRKKLGQILSVYAVKSLGQYLTQIFRFIEGQYLAQIKLQIVKQIGCVDAAFPVARQLFMKYWNIYFTKKMRVIIERHFKKYHPQGRPYETHFHFLEIIRRQKSFLVAVADFLQSVCLSVCLSVLFFFCNQIYLFLDQTIARKNEREI